MCVEVGEFFTINYEHRKIQISKRLLLTTLLIILLQAKVVKNEKIAKVTNIACKTIDTKYSTMKQCKMKAFRPEVTAVTVEILLLQGAADNITLKSVLRKRGVETGRPLVDFTINFCAFLRNKRRNIWADIMYQLMGLEEWSNLNHTCPFDHDILVDGYRFDGKKMGKFIPFPGGHYTFTTWWYTFDVLRTIITLNFQLYDK